MINIQKKDISVKCLTSLLIVVFAIKKQLYFYWKKVSSIIVVSHKLRLRLLNYLS